MTQRIAFLTSGGDSQGMNAAIRAIVRMAIHRGCEPYAVLEGFKGLVQGPPMIIPFGWNDVAQIISEGGTIIKSSRCPEFRERLHRKQAARHLIELGIDKLIVIGGDGSLTGADIFRQEWSGLLAELVEEGEVRLEVAARYERMMIVGLVGSIDNDMCGTEITIGANSSLHRIIEAIDCIHSTARSHQRAFVIEVMGRHCGWLALNAAMSCAADWLLIPEDPPTDGWEMRMCDTVNKHRQLGRTVSIVIVAEGAVDRSNQAIKSEYVCKVLTQSGLDARVTTLGHIQRGGSPSAFDRYLGTMQGIKAVEAVLESDPEKTPSLLVCMIENKVRCRPLIECVSKTRIVTQAMDELRFEGALQLRDPDFRANYALWTMLHRGPFYLSTDCNSPIRGSTIGVMNCGAPAGGMNAAVAAATICGLVKGCRIIGVSNGFEGLINGELHELGIKDIMNKVGQGGSFLGTNRTLPSENMSVVRDRLATFDSLIIIGGFEALAAQLELVKAGVLLPIVVIPATISNNVPGTEVSIGSDTALNVIVQSCDMIRQSASSSRKRVFIVDVQGGYCGYLATLAGLASGASRSYIHEEGVRLADLREDAYRLRTRFTDNRCQGRLIIRNEKSNDVYNAELMSKILESEAEGTFDSRWVVLGHLQQGGSPSPLDRVRAVRLAVLAVQYIQSLLAPASETPEDFSFLSANCTNETVSSLDGIDGYPICHAVVVGVKGPRVCFTAACDLESQADMQLRRPIDQWWKSLRLYLLILAKFSDPIDAK